MGRLAVGCDAVRSDVDPLEMVPDRPGIEAISRPTSTVSSLSPRPPVARADIDTMPELGSWEIFRHERPCSRNRKRRDPVGVASALCGWIASIYCKNSNTRRCSRANGQSSANSKDDRSINLDRCPETHRKARETMKCQNNEGVRFDAFSSDEHLSM